MMQKDAVTKIYINFKGDIPDLDGVDDCDWFIQVKGDPVTSKVLSKLRTFIESSAAEKCDDDKSIDYYDLCCEAEEFLVKEYGYEPHNDNYETEEIDVEI